MASYSPRPLASEGTKNGKLLVRLHSLTWRFLLQ